MTRCSQCKIDYPSYMVQLMKSSLGSFMVCGVCALDISNQIHGTQRATFDGEVAEQMRKEAIEFRQQKTINIKKNSPKES